MVPGEEVKDLLLAAGDGSKSFHDGTGCLPRCLCCWGKEDLPDTGEETGLVQGTPCFLGPQHELTHCLGYKPCARPRACSFEGTGWDVREQRTVLL